MRRRSFVGLLSSALVLGGTFGHAGPAQAASRPSGLPFDSGVYHGNSVAIASSLTSLRGRALDVMSIFPARQSWKTLHEQWWAGTFPSGFAGTVSVGMPLWPENGSLATAAAGGYNADWLRFGKDLAARYPTAYVRIGWEMNLPNGWAATPANKAQWIHAFRLAAVNVRRGGPGLRVVWNPNEGAGQTGFADAAEVWPGDLFVDVVGIDAYDWWPAYTSDSNWAAHRDKVYGYNHWLNFARAHGKKFALPEWGLGSGSSASGGDNPKYFDYVYQWLKANASDVAYEAYFNETMAYQRSDLTSQNPKAAAAYRSWMSRLA